MLPVPPKIRAPLLNLLHDAQTHPSAITRSHALLGDIISHALKQFSYENQFSLSNISFVGAYIDIELPLRSPPTSREADASLGWSTMIASETGITIVSDFDDRSGKLDGREVRLLGLTNGQLFRHPTKLRVCLDIDDFATITFIPPESIIGEGTTISRRCGPGNMLINYAMRYSTSNQVETDGDGLCAARGNINYSVVYRFLHAHDYIENDPPVNMLTEMFGNHEAQGLIDECLFLGMTTDDTIATITHITAQNLVRQYRRLLAAHFAADAQVTDLFICGAGAKNRNIVDCIEAELPGAVVTRSLEDIGINGEAKNAVTYAQLGLSTVLGQASRSFAVDSWSQVRGKIMCGKKWEDISQHILRFADGKVLPPLSRVVVEGQSFSPTRSSISIPELLSDPVPPILMQRGTITDILSEEVRMEL